MKKKRKNHKRHQRKIKKTKSKKSHVEMDKGSVVAVMDRDKVVAEGEEEAEEVVAKKTATEMVDTKKKLKAALIHGKERSQVMIDQTLSRTAIPSLHAQDMVINRVIRFRVMEISSISRETQGLQDNQGKKETSQEEMVRGELTVAVEVVEEVAEEEVEEEEEAVVEVELMAVHRTVIPPTRQSKPKIDNSEDLFPRWYRTV